jgi:hypothetical protein
VTASDCYVEQEYKKGNIVVTVGAGGWLSADRANLA